MADDLNKHIDQAKKSIRHSRISRNVATKRNLHEKANKHMAKANEIFSTKLKSKFENKLSNK